MGNSTFPTDDACSFVSITFDSRFRLLELLLVGLTIFGLWLIGE